MIYIDVRLFTQPLNGSAHTHQVAVGIFASMHTDVMYTMGFLKPDSLAIYARTTQNLWDFLYVVPHSKFPKEWCAQM